MDKGDPYDRTTTFYKILKFSSVSRPKTHLREVRFTTVGLKKKGKFETFGLFWVDNPPKSSTDDQHCTRTKNEKTSMYTSSSLTHPIPVVVNEPDIYQEKDFGPSDSFRPLGHPKARRITPDKTLTEEEGLDRLYSL